VRSKIKLLGRNGPLRLRSGGVRRVRAISVHPDHGVLSTRTASALATRTASALSTRTASVLETARRAPRARAARPGSAGAEPVGPGPRGELGAHGDSFARKASPRSEHCPQRGLTLAPEPVE